jgi:hypothetical protein
MSNNYTSFGAGAPLARVLPLDQDLTDTSLTGTLVETTMKTTTIAAGLLGTKGGVRITARLSPTTQGATATTVRFKYGGVVISTSSVAAANQQLHEVTMRCRNATNAQRTIRLAVGGAAVLGPITTDTTVDSTLSQPLILTLQLGAITDNWTVQVWQVEQFFAP